MQCACKAADHGPLHLLIRILLHPTPPLYFRLTYSRCVRMPHFTNLHRRVRLLGRGEGDEAEAFAHARLSVEGDGGAQQGAVLFEGALPVVRVEVSKSASQ